jgi:flagellar biosynthesis protein FliR
MMPTLDSLQQMVPIIALVSIRIGATLASLPAPFGGMSPALVRTALSILIAYAIVLAYTGGTLSVDMAPIALVGAAVGEALVGAVIGLSARFILAATEVAGSIAGHAMGLGFATSVDPEYGEDALPTTRLIGVLGMLIFLVCHGHHAVFRALATSISIAKPGHVLFSTMQSGIVRMGASMVGRGLQIAAPVVGTMFIIQLGTALASKAAPRVQFFAFTFAISVATGLVTLYIAAPAVVTAIAVEIRRLPAALALALGAG